MGECFSHSPSSEAAATAAGASSSSSKTTKSNATNMNNPNAPVVISACNKHTATLIFLHGLGDTGQGWASSLAEIRTDNTRIVCPTAPTVNVTLNPGKEGEGCKTRLIRAVKMRKIHQHSIAAFHR
jgi:hypothetical protein